MLGATTAVLCAEGLPPNIYRSGTAARLLALHCVKCEERLGELLNLAAPVRSWLYVRSWEQELRSRTVEHST